MAAKARELGIPAEVLDARELAKLEPAVRMDVIGAIYFPKDCHLTPHRFMARLKSLAKEAGVEFSWETDALAIHREGRRVRAVVTNKGEFASDEVILCAGSWSPALAREMRMKLPMQPGKGYTLTLENPPALPTICSILSEARVAVTPMGNSLRVGGTMEMAGLNEDINSVRVRGIIKATTRYYPEFEEQHFDGVKAWRGLRPVSPDGLPYLGRTSRYDNVVVATGHAMMGLSLGPVSGKLVAQILSGEIPTINIQLLNPDRYA